MKNSAAISCFAAIATTSIAVLSSTFSPVLAYSVTNTHAQAGNPVGDLWNVKLDSRFDVGRQLEPVEWLVPKASSGAPIDLSAVLNITVNEFTSNSLKLNLDIKNTTASNYIYKGELFKANILSFGFGVTPNATGTKLTNKDGQVVFNSAVVQNGQQQFTGGFKQIDVCIYAANGCDGGNVNQGLKAGDSDRFTLEILGSFYNSKVGANQVTLSDFPLKFQTAVGSYEPAGVPEPITMVGSGLALGFGALFKQKAAKKLKKAEVKN